jgi:hypothetical protein
LCHEGILRKTGGRMTWLEVGKEDGNKVSRMGSR